MKNIKKIFLLIAVMIIIAVAIQNFHQTFHKITIEASDSTIKLTKAKQTLVIGKTLQLKLTGTNQSVTWSSGKPKVASVINGKVTAKTVGVTTITATCNARKYICKITVIEKKIEVVETGEYNSKEEVALYIHTYQKLPKNYITKEEATSLGWKSGYLDTFAPGKSIGGDYFSNYEKLLPEKRGRTYIECDIDTKGAKSRGAKRIVYSDDGLIYYTDDHYETFTLLYKEG